MSSFKSLCGDDSFWNANQTWNTSDPQLSNCFRKTVLIWGPCALFWLLLPFHAASILKSRLGAYPISPLHICKLSFVAALIILATIDFFFYILHAGSDPVDILDPSVRLLTFCAVAAVIVAERKRGLRISPLQWFFWLVFILASILNMYSHIRSYWLQETSAFGLSTFTLSVVCMVFSFITHFFVEPPSKYAGPSPLAAIASENACPYISASFPSRLLFTWFTGFAWKGFKRSLTSQDLWDLIPSLRSAHVVPVFQRHLKEIITKKTAKKSDGQPSDNKDGNISFNKDVDDIKVVTKPSPPEHTASKKADVHMLIPIIKTFKTAFLTSSFLKLLSDIILFSSPIILKYIINFAVSEEEMWKGILYAVLLFLVNMLYTILLAHYFHGMFSIGLGIKTAMTSALYRKALRVSSVSKKDITTGEVVNLMSVDVQKIVELMPFANMIWSAPFQIIVAVALLWQTVGPSVLAGLLVMVLLIPFNGVIAAKSRQLQVQQMKEKDQRVKMMNEILQGIKLLKLYAWEPSFQEIMMTIRSKEINILKKIGYLASATSFAWACAPFVVSLVTFATYVLSDPDNVLNSERAFVSLSLFNILRFPMSMLPMMIMSMVQCTVSLKRINKFMNSDEVKEETAEKTTYENLDNDISVKMSDASFCWEANSENLTLKNINLEVKKGSLVAVVGTVGSGKSSLISAILGELDKVSGQVYLEGILAYTSQQAWIQNETVKNNILFSALLDEERYQMVLKNCELLADLEVLPAGDRTEIGEKGINLSGGQKQRVSLARAVYSDADLYLMDDPLSAVDAHVGKSLFDNVIGPNGMLADKTRILVTHSITHLSKMDKIIVMKAGEISEIGTYQELVAQKGAFADFLIQYLTEEADPDEMKTLETELEQTIGHQELLALKHSENGETKRKLSGEGEENGHYSPSPVKGRSVSRQHSTTPPDSKTIIKSNQEQQQYEAEKMETGKVKLEIYLYYFVNMGVLLFSGCVLFFTLNQVFSAFSTVWMSFWSDANNNGTVSDSDRDLYLGVYGGLGMAQTVTVIIASLLLYLSTLRGAERLHNNMLAQILRSPLHFFNTTPQGRILNRIGKDVDVLDSSMPMILRGWITCLLGVISTLLIITYNTPIFIAPLVIIMIGYYLVQKVYVTTSRQLKRLESVSISPIYSHFGETVNGASTIRAYKLQEKFITQSEQIVDQSLRASFPSITANRWLSLNLETVGNIVIFFAALFSVLGKGSLSPGLVGLSVSYALSVTQTLNWLVRMVSEFETNIVAVERVKEYTEVPSEAEWVLEDVPNLDSDWPKEGHIEFSSYSMRYREHLDFVIKDLSVTIAAREKVGIVGRTGAGKSSFTLALFRIVEASSGKILIDGMDISKLGLHQLRNKLTIIPQDPVLFSGSLRMNLDPFNKYSDDELWMALKTSHLDKFVSSLSAGLEYVIAEGGDNLSVGQRQLVCLARAILRKTKILVLDEATAAMDLETDDMIQNTIREEFVGCTVITIAHRLNTIMDYTRIMVLDSGVVLEYDRPEVLLANKKSAFYLMAKDAGLVS